MAALALVAAHISPCAAQTGGASLVATPNPVLAAVGLGRTTILWDTGDGASGEVRVVLDGGPEVPFARAPSGAQDAPWIQRGGRYEFRLYRDATPATPVARATVAAGAMLWASPNPVPLVDGVGTAGIVWDTGGAGPGEIWASVNGGEERPFAQGSAGLAAAPWIVGGAEYLFRLYAGSGRQILLASARVSAAPALAASPNPVASGSSTVVSWSAGPHATGQVWVSMDGGPEVPLAESPSGTQVAAWITRGSEYRFSLYAGTERAQRLATTVVSGGGPFALRLAPLAAGLDQPLFVTHAGDGSGRLYVVEKRGRIRLLTGAGPTTFLDLTGVVGSGGSEQGLLGLAFHPRYAVTRHLYVNYTDIRGDTVIARYTAAPDGSRVDPASARVLLPIDQPAENHNGGWLGFGPDGHLYLALGDGGGAGDAFGNAQNGSTLLGKVLRIDVDGAQPYAIPPDNPFAGVAGMRAEIWALGLRNPWRPSFDRGDGTLFIADVGQQRAEEIDVEPAGLGGRNYGWPRTEGTLCHPDPAAPCDRTGITFPVAEYGHGSGDCSITGGYVYRGRAIPFLRGHYLFGDFCSGRIWALARGADGRARSTLVLETAPFNLSSFGEDEAGEVYVTGLADGMIYSVAASP